MLKSTTVPCQYWYDEKWYDLTTFDASTDFFSTGAMAVSGEYAAFNFCQKIN